LDDITSRFFEAANFPQPPKASFRSLGGDARTAQPKTLGLLDSSWILEGFATFSVATRRTPAPPFFPCRYPAVDSGTVMEVAGSSSFFYRARFLFSNHLDVLPAPSPLLMASSEVKKPREVPPATPFFFFAIASRRLSPLPLKLVLLIFVFIGQSR